MILRGSDGTAGNEGGEIVIEKCSKFVDPVSEAVIVGAAFTKAIVTTLAQTMMNLP